MDWVVEVAASAGLGVLAGWIYAGFPGLRKRRKSGAREQIGVGLDDVREAGVQIPSLPRWNREQRMQVVPPQVTEFAG